MADTWRVASVSIVCFDRVTQRRLERRRLVARRRGLQGTGSIAASSAAATVLLLLPKLHSEEAAVVSAVVLVLELEELKSLVLIFADDADADMVLHCRHGLPWRDNHYWRRAGQSKVGLRL